MRAFRLAVPVVAVLAVAWTLGRPGIRARAELLQNKITGQARLPWSEVAVQMAPWSMQPRARQWLAPGAEPWIRPLAEAEPVVGPDTGRAVLFDGPTPNLAKLNCHLSVLPAGTTPHAPHRHREEEIILPLRGEVEILRGESFDDPDLEVAAAGPEQLVFHASEQPHTIRASDDEPAVYLVLRWDGFGNDTAPAVQSRVLDLRPGWENLRQAAVDPNKIIVLDEPTALLGRLHVHLAQLAPGAESPEHVDQHDVVMVTLDGRIETLGTQVEPNTAIFHPAHLPHSIRNVSRESARYLVVEFHSAD